MKKRNLLIGGLLVLGVTASACGLAACGPGEPPKEKVPEINETIRYTEKTNPYAELEWQEYADIDDWADKEANAPVYYQFEGSYSEAYQGNYSRDYLYMNCYEDGSVHGKVRNTANSNKIEDYYGFWTNVNRQNRESLVLHILSYNGGEYNGGSYELVCDKSTGYYDFSSNIAISKWGNQRAMSISGYRYSPVTSLEVTTSVESSGCILGDKMNYSGLVVTVNRENGKSIAIDEESYTDPTCRVKFEGFDSSEAGDNEITVSYVNTEVSTKYTVKVMGVSAIAVDTKDIVKEYIIGDKFSTDNLIVKATREDGVVVDFDLKKCEVTEPENWSEPGEKKVTVKYGELETTYDVKVFDVKAIALDTENVLKEYKVGDKINTEGLVIKATRDDDTEVELGVDKCTVSCSGAAGAEVPVTVTFRELSQSYNVKIDALIFNGKINGKDATITLNNPTDCEYSYDGAKYQLKYSLMKDKYGSTVMEGAYELTAPEGSEISDDILNAVRTVTMNKDESTFAKALIYKIPDNGDGIPGDERYENEIYNPGGYSEVRYLIIDEVAETATISYKYWYHGQKDTYVCKYTIENGVLTLTEEISSQLGWGGSSFSKIHKVWQLHDDGTATRVPQTSAE